MTLTRDVQVDQMSVALQNLGSAITGAVDIDENLQPGFALTQGKQILYLVFDDAFFVICANADRTIQLCG